MAGARIHEPTESGELGRNTRSMFRNRPGIPRSSINNTVPSAVPAAAIALHRRISPRNSSRSMVCAAAPSTAAAPAVPPA